MSVLIIGDKRLGAALLDAGLLTDEELQRALERHREVGGSLAEVLVDMGLLDASAAPPLTAIRRHNPLAFDFVLKRHLRSGRHRLAASVFETRPFFVPEAGA